MQESCKLIQNLQDSCKNLARYQSSQKNKSGYKCCRKHLWGKLLFIEQITKPNSIKSFLARIQNLARILQESCKFLNSENFMLVFLVAQTNWKPNEMTDIKIFDQQNWTYLTFSVNAFWMWNLARILQISCKILNSKINFRQKS